MAFSSSSISGKRWTPATVSSSRAATMAFDSVDTVTVLSTKGTPMALSRLKTGITGSTSNLKL